MGCVRDYNHEEYFDTLTMQIHSYQNEGTFFLCGDYNSRIGDHEDFIPTVDDISPRDVIDFKTNSLCDSFIDFLITTNCCVLNGRNMVNNDFTCRNISVVDYCIVPHDDLHIFNDFNVLKSHTLFNECCLGHCEPIGIPDHNLLCWNISLRYSAKLNTANAQEPQYASSTRFNVKNIPHDFMQGTQWINQINVLITKLEHDQDTATTCDLIYTKFCDAVKEEMFLKLRHWHTSPLNSSKNKKRKPNKPWWSEQLTVLWNMQCKAEQAWRQAHKTIKHKLKFKWKECRRTFDREYKKSKRNHWQQLQDDIIHLQSNDQQLFWKKIGSIGIVNDRHESIPWEIVSDDGTISYSKEDVLQKWKDDYSALYNPSPQRNRCPETGNNMDINNDLGHNNNLNGIITLREVERALLAAKCGKAPGIDNIPVDVLKNTTAAHFLLQLFNMCFTNSIIPEAWQKSIVTPIPKDRTLDRRNPYNYRGLSLANSMSKVYCGVLNSRLSTWAETNGKLSDEQNGFRKRRSCADHLSTFTLITETRRKRNQPTYAAFIDFSKAFDRVDRGLLWTKLQMKGVDGHMLQALKSLYQNTQSCLRINGYYTQWFNVLSGVKQGCLLSPLLFNLFIDDLTQKIKDLKCGVPFENKQLPILLYADDIVLLSDTEKGLQLMLNTLNTWCEENNMLVNLEKSKIMHFRKGPKTTKSCFKFKLGKDVMDFVSEYKYLGLIITEFNDYNVTAKHIAKSAGRALGLLISKAKAIGSMPYNCYRKLFDNIVQPVIDYGSAIWGTKSYSCINNIQHRAERFYLGLGKYSPNAALHGDMGWNTQEHKGWLNVCRSWRRLNNMDDNRKNKHVFKWAKGLAFDHNVKNWVHNIHAFFKVIDMQHVCMADHFLNKSIIHDLDTVLYEYFYSKWRDEMNRQDARRGHGRNKLRTYRLFKFNLESEEYLKINNRHHRSALAKFRAGVAPIGVETGRYKGIKFEDRLCTLCDANNVEDELHVLISCNFYSDIRDDLFEHCMDVDYNFKFMSEVDQLCFILSNKQMVSKSARVCHQILQRRYTFIYN
jgi:hypothetical protein